MIKTFIKNRTTESEIRSALPLITKKIVNKAEINLLYAFDKDIYIIKLKPNKYGKFYFDSYKIISIAEMINKYKKKQFRILNFTNII